MSSVEVESTCDSELAYDITTRLDLCRRPNWPERDSVTPGLLDRGAEPQEAVRSGSHPFPRLAASEKEQHEFVAQAELSHHPVRLFTTCSAPLTCSWLVHSSVFLSSPHWETVGHIIHPCCSE